MKLFSKIQNKIEGKSTNEQKIKNINTSSNEANELYKEANSIIFAKESFSIEEYELFLKAAEIYTKAIKLDPKQVRFYNNRGFAYYQVTKILLPHVSQEGRIGFFCKTDNRFKENSMETGLLSAEVREILHDCIQQALNNFSKILEFEPNDTTSLIWRGNVFIDLGRFDEALQDLEKAKSITDDSGLRDSAIENITRVSKIIDKANDQKAKFIPNKQLKFETVKLGNKTWMAENLNVNVFRNGDPIPELKTLEEWQKAGNNGKPAWCYYNNNQENGKKYGKLYNGYAINDPRGLAPEGWHVPSDEDWKELEIHLGMSRSDADAENGRGIDIGGKLKSTGFNHWSYPNTGATNESGFSALAGGCRFYYDDYDNIGRSAKFWSSTALDSDSAWIRSLSYYESEISRNIAFMKNGFSVRCIKD